jgi:transposase
MRYKTIDTIPVLTEQMYTILNSFSSSRSLPSSLVKRAQLILMASKGVTNLRIAEAIGLHYTNVTTWRNRFLLNLPSLREIEATTPEKLQEEIKKILTDEKRPGASRKFTLEQIMKIVDLACKNPREFGYEVSQWSLNLLVKEITKQGIVDHISAKSVSRFLKMK